LFFSLSSIRLASDSSDERGAQVLALQEQLAEKDDKVGALKIALAERDEQLDLAISQLEGMKDMMRQGGAEEVGVLRAQMAERDEQLDLANTQLEGMKEY